MRPIYWRECQELARIRRKADAVSVVVSVFLCLILGAAALLG
jgi:hypothetical protein